MNKFEKRAREILDSQSNPYNIIKAMCELAEEVEKEKKTNYDELLIKYNLALEQLNTLVYISYSKEQIEKLLQKQRELCANNCSPFSNDYNSILNAKLNINEQ